MPTSLIIIWSALAALVLWRHVGAWWGLAAAVLCTAVFFTARTP